MHPDKADGEFWALSRKDRLKQSFQFSSNVVELAASRALRRAFPSRFGSLSNGGGAESFSSLKLQSAKLTHAESGVAVETKRMSLEIWSFLTAVITPTIGGFTAPWQ